jgi:hypothetical protein
MTGGGGEVAAAPGTMKLLHQSVKFSAENALKPTYERL